MLTLENEISPSGDELPIENINTLMQCIKSSANEIHLISFMDVLVPHVQNVTTLCLQNSTISNRVLQWNLLNGI